MKIKLSYIFCVLVLSTTILTAQEKQTEKATKAFDQYSYVPAIEKYEVLVEKGYTDDQIYMNLGDANYANAKYTEAADWYSKLFKVEGATIDADYMYKYAQTLKSTEEYEASNIWMEKFRSAKSADVRAIKIAAKPNYLEEIEEHSGRYDIKSLAINSSASDFAPAFNGEQLIFATARDSGNITRNIHEWDNQPFLNIFSASPVNDDFGNAQKLDKNTNKKTHESSAVFTKDGSTVYFTRNNSENGNFTRDDKGVSRLKVYRAKVANGTWNSITELPFNSDDYSSAHPTLSADESTLYFASDMPGTVGQSDIFSVNIGSDGSFGPPVNLGNVINTEARETFPFVTSESVLYFASDGHPGLGGLDIFATKIEDLGNLNIVNIGKPVNSEQDDFSFIINDETKKGFFASNRDGGLGSDDIYSFIENEEIDLTCNTVVSGTVKNQEDGSIIPGARVTLTNAEGTTVAETVSAADGSFMLDGDCREGDYTIVAVGEGYDPVKTNFTSKASQDNIGIEVMLSKIIKEATLGTDLAKYLNLNPVYFDLDQSNIRPDAATTLNAVIGYLTEFPNMNIQVQSHTDVKASKSYNDRLSDRRAKSTVAYLIANGINEARVVGQGFGETQLTNDCTTLEKCTDEEHEENRRSEFIVME